MKEITDCIFYAVKHSIRDGSMRIGVGETVTAERDAKYPVLFVTVKDAVGTVKRYRVLVEQIA